MEWCIFIYWYFSNVSDIYADTLLWCKQAHLKYCEILWYIKFDTLTLPFHFLSSMLLLAQWLPTGPAQVELFWVNDSNTDEYTSDPTLVNIWKTIHRNMKHRSSLRRCPTISRSEKAVQVSWIMDSPIGVIKSHVGANYGKWYITWIMWCATYIGLCIIRIWNWNWKFAQDHCHFIIKHWIQHTCCCSAPIGGLGQHGTSIHCAPFAWRQRVGPVVMALLGAIH